MHKLSFSLGLSLFIALIFSFAPSVDATINSTLRQGSRGEQVRELQETLTSLGFYSGPITGYFGNLTKSAVIEFQEKYADEILVNNGLTRGNGFFGSASRSKLNELAKTKSANSETSIETDNVSKFTEETKNKTNKDVSTISNEYNNKRQTNSSGNTIKLLNNSKEIKDLSTTIITKKHRYQEGKMFSGWGPHLGHLLRASDDSLWFVDDMGNDATHNLGLTYYHLVNGQWLEVATQPFIGKVQQNTGSVLGSNGIIYTYGVDILNNLIEECYFNTITESKFCGPLPYKLKSTNYIGAAISPSGTKVVWWTNGVDGGGGELQHIYNTGSGWSEAVTSTILGYNALGYINIAFEDDENFVMLAQGVTGFAPNWTPYAVYGEGNIRKPINWKTLSSGLSSDPAQSTHDIWVDPQGGAHVLAKGSTGSAIYFYRPKGGSISSALKIIPVSSRARFIDSDDGMIHLVYGLWVYYGDILSDDLYDLAYSKIQISGPISWDSITKQKLLLSKDIGYIYAIYPESRAYQTARVKGVNFALTDKTQENRVVHIEYYKPQIKTDVSINKTDYLSGDSVSVMAVNSEATAKDWLAIVPAGKKLIGCCIGIPWVYANNFTTSTKTNIIADVPAGTYEIVYFKNDSFIEIARSSSFTVTGVQKIKAPLGVPVSVRSNLVTFSSNTDIVNMGEYAVLSTIATPQVKSCTISGGVFGKDSYTSLPIWSHWTGFLTEDTVYKLNCKDEKGDNDQHSITIKVQGSVSPIIISANPETINSGGYSTISGSAKNMQYCLLSGGLYGENGQQTLLPDFSGWSGTLTQNTTFRIKCKGNNEVDYEKSVTVKVL